jgi:uncharacterized protein YycO
LTCKRGRGRKNMRKLLAVGIILLLIGTCVVSGSNINITDCTNSSGVYMDKSRNEEQAVPDGVIVGDLLLIDYPWVEWVTYKIPGPHNEHGAIYVGNNMFVDATYAGVKQRNYSHYCSLQKNFVFLRVKTANESQRNAAAAWAVSKIDSPYQYFFDFPLFGLKIANPNLSFPTAKAFYCMELLWASYYHQGIDIDQNGWKIPWWVIGDDILQDDDIEIIYCDITNSTEITKPFKGVYLANKKIVSTLNNSLIFGSIDIEVVTYNENITRMEFYVDNVYEATDDTEPYCWRWSNRTVGRRVITAIAYDDEGNSYFNSITIWKTF